MSLWPTTQEICDVFTEEINALGGTVADVVHDGGRLFLRSLLPRGDDVGRGDRVQGGVALRTLGDDVVVHPYLFRQVCTNGAITAWAVDSRHVRRVTDDALEYEAAQVSEAIRAQIQACAAPEILTMTVERVRAARDADADMLLSLMSALRGLAGTAAVGLLAAVEERFQAGRDRSAFGLMNAITSVARDTRDPETRWRMEELGGGVPAQVRPRPRPLPKRRLRRDVVRPETDDEGETPQRHRELALR